MSPLPTRYTNSVELLLYAIAGTIHNFFAKPNMDQILANQRFIEIDQIYSDLHRLRDWEQVRSERSDQVVYQIDSKELRIHVTHGRKTEFDFGIDLIYEIVGEKYVVIQYKRLGRSIDSVQMEKMRRHFCPPWQQVACRIKEELPHRKVRLGTLCTPYYKIVDEDPFSGDYVPLCFLRARMKEEELKTANPDLLDQTISGDAFEELFVECLVGSRWTYQPGEVSLSTLNEIYGDSPKYAYLAREVTVDRDE